VGSGRIEGVDATLGIDASGKLDSWWRQVRFCGIWSLILRISSTPVSIEGADVDAKITFNPFHHVCRGRMDIHRRDTTLEPSGRIFARRTARVGRVGVWIAGLNALKPDRLLELWPRRTSSQKDAQMGCEERSMPVRADATSILAFRLKPG